MAAEGLLTMNLYQFSLNGKPVQLQAADDRLLLEVLREHFKITSVKNGCAPQQQCGACVTLVNGIPKNSCALTMDKVQGKEILTLEGVSEEERQLFARAFQVAAGLQCGFCTPGMMMTAYALLEQNPDPSELEIREAISGNLCRCTGYVNIVRSIQHAAAAMREEATVAAD